MILSLPHQGPLSQYSVQWLHISKTSPINPTAFSATISSWCFPFITAPNVTAASMTFFLFKSSSINQLQYINELCGKTRQKTYIRFWFFVPDLCFIQHFFNAIKSLKRHCYSNLFCTIRSPGMSLLQSADSNNVIIPLLSK